MAYKKKGRRRSFNLRRVRLAIGVPALALAASDVASGAIHSGVVDPLRVISVNASYSWSNIITAVDDGLEFGLAHSDYSAAEIEECLEASASIDIGDKLAQEKANRLVRRIGSIAATTIANSGAAFNDGRQVKTRLNWLLSTGDFIQLWIRNGSTVIWTTGSEVSLIGDMWVKDSV